MGLRTTFRAMAADGLRALRRAIADEPGATDEPEATGSVNVPAEAPLAADATPVYAAHAATPEPAPVAEAAPSEAAPLDAEPVAPSETPLLAASLAASLQAQGPPDPQLVDAVIEMLHTVYDPEIPVDVYELGLIYGVQVDAFGYVQISMTLTSPNCPSAQALPDEVREKVASIDGVSGADVEIVWDPPWSPDRMSEEARLELNM